MRRPINKHDEGKLRSAAFAKGYRVERAAIRHCWLLIHEKTGEAAMGAHGGTAFNVQAALKFLATLPDR